MNMSQPGAEYPIPTNALVLGNDQDINFSPLAVKLYRQITAKAYFLHKIWSTSEKRMKIP